MFFVLKAAFWLGLVFLLMPDNAPAPRTAQAPAASTESVTAAVVQGAVALCRNHAETCARGAAALTEGAQRELVRAVVSPSHAPAAATPAAAPGDTLTQDDLAVPFGGVQAPAGAAPRRAPLPPRRPV